MRLIISKLLLIGLSGLVLSACTTTTDMEEGAENTTEEIVSETVEAGEEKSIVADEVTTIFHPEVTRLRHLTEEDLEWYDIIMTRLNAIDDYSGDRETVYEIAEEYGEDPEELWFDWLEIVDAKWYGDDGNYVILPRDFHELTMEIVEKNIVGETVEDMGSSYHFFEENFTTSIHQKVNVSGNPYTLTYMLKHSEDYQVAEIIQFKVNGEKIDL